MHTPVKLHVSADCWFEGASPSLTNAVKQQLTLENPKYQDARKYGRWIGKKLKPFLYFYEYGPGGLHFPRGFANHAVLLCRKIMGVNPQIVDLRRSLPEVGLGFTGTLRPYQKEALQAALKHDFGVIESGTGSGKTIIALAIIAARRQPTLVLVHTKELLYQWAERVQEFMHCTPGMLGDGHHDLQPVTIAIVNTARRQLDELPKHFGHICVD